MSAYGIGLHVVADDLGSDDCMDWLEQSEAEGVIELQASAFLAPHAAFADFLLERDRE